MTEVISVNKSQIFIDKNEVVRYLGYGKNAVTDEVLALIDQGVKEVYDAINPKVCFDVLLIKNSDDAIKVGDIEIYSKALSQHLKGCKRAAIFTATLGFEVDRIIQKYSAVLPVMAVIVQAVGTVCIENLCDLVCENIKQKSGCNITSRFSPGYADFSLENQSEIFKILDPGRKIGVTLTKSLLMTPTKSVSAVVGIGCEIDTDKKTGCNSCKLLDCQFRRYTDGY